MGDKITYNIEYKRLGKHSGRKESRLGLDFVNGKTSTDDAVQAHIMKRRGWKVTPDPTEAAKLMLAKKKG